MKRVVLGASVGDRVRIGVWGLGVRRVAELGCGENASVFSGLLVGNAEGDRTTAQVIDAGTLFSLLFPPGFGALDRR